MASLSLSTLRTNFQGKSEEKGCIRDILSFLDFARRKCSALSISYHSKGEKEMCALLLLALLRRENPLSSCNFSSRSNFVERNATGISEVCSMTRGKESLIVLWSVCSSGLLLKDEPTRSYNRWLLALMLVFLTTTIVFGILYGVAAKKSNTTTTTTVTTTSTTTATTATAITTATTMTSTAPFGKQDDPVHSKRRIDRQTFDLCLVDTLCLTPYCIKAGTSVECSFVRFLWMKYFSGLSVGIDRCNDQSMWRFLPFRLWLMAENGAHSWGL